MKPYYEDEAVTLYHGNCLEVTAWLDADVVVTDPPYGIAHSSNKPGAPRRGVQIANDESAATRDAALALWTGPAVIFGTCRSPVPPFPIRAVLVWDKGGHVGMGDLSLPWKQNWEHIYVSGSGFYGRRGSGVLRVNALPPWAGKFQHPHEKPLGLLQLLIDKCPPGVVADPFAGTGTTLVAAKSQGRRAVGVELEERYCEVAAKRLAQDVLDFGGAA